MGATLGTKAHALLVAQAVRANDRGGACRAHFLPWDEADARLAQPDPTDRFAAHLGAGAAAAQPAPVVELPVPPPTPPVRLFRFEVVQDSAPGHSTAGPHGGSDGALGDATATATAPPAARPPRLVASEARVGAGTLCSS
eukprot:3726725-Prymnesium_polylepis.1